MDSKKINRRKFLINSFEAAAGIGVLAGCDKRAVVGSDIRPPSAPADVSYELATDASGTVSVTLSWDRHDPTDVTGAKSETGIKGYNIYRAAGSASSGTLIASMVPQPPNYVSPTYVDANGLLVGQTYAYTVTAIDESGNESPQSDPQLVAIQPRVYVYSATDPSVASITAPGATISNPSIQVDVVNRMIDAAVTQMQVDNGSVATGATIDKVWESLFTGPALTAATLIGIKINTLGGGNVSTKPAVVQAIVTSLKRMLGGTFNEYNIIVFDDRMLSLMTDAGYTLRDDGVHYRVACTHVNSTLHQVRPATTKEPDASLWVDAVTVSGISQRLSAIIKAVDYIINVPVLKDHVQAGITFSMKNLYGIIDSPSTLHATMCSPYIPALYSTQVNGVMVKDKIRLIIGDAIVGCITGGPAGSPTNLVNTIVVGTDPVATDTWAMRTINTLRKARSGNLPQIGFNPSKTGLPDARHIFDASLPPYSLGSTNCVAKEVAVS
jgi:uncharacterized protein (DUF362 family)